MCRFPFHLPPDIAFKIFSYLEQSDCIECMLVCRQWFSEIPLYATDLWRQISISLMSWHKVNRCVIRCLGPHTEGVSIRNMHIFNALNRLKKLNCDITSLGQCLFPYRPHMLSVHIEQRSTIEIERQASSRWIYDSTKFFSAIMLFSNTLKELQITNRSLSLSVSQLLHHLPKLTHLTLLFDNLPYPHQYEAIEDDASSSPSNLIYLHLDSTLHFDRRILPALRRCPRLRALLLSSGSLNILPTPANFGHIFQVCPRLSHFAWNEQRTFPGVKDDPLCKRWMKASSSDDNQGIRELFFSGNMEDLDKIVPTLLKSQHSIASLELVNESDSTEWNSLSYFNFPRLKRLTLHNLKMQESGWIKLLTGCQNIESLELTLQTVYMDRMTEAISSLKYLKYLYIAQDTSDAAVWSNASMLSSSSSLQRLRLIGISMDDNVLLDLCELRSLKDLSVSEQPYTSSIGLDGLLMFADKLKESCLETLGLIYFECLEDKVLQRLANVRSLSMLTILFSPRITDAGVKSFTHGGITTKKIDVQYCQSVSRLGLWTEEYC